MPFGTDHDFSFLTEAEIRALTDPFGDPQFTGSQNNMLRERLIDLGVSTVRYDSDLKLESDYDTGTARIRIIHG